MREQKLEKFPGRLKNFQENLDYFPGSSENYQGTPWIFARRARPAPEVQEASGKFRELPANSANVPENIGYFPGISGNYHGSSRIFPKSSRSFPGTSRQLRKLPASWASFLESSGIISVEPSQEVQAPLLKVKGPSPDVQRSFPTSKETFSEIKWTCQKN